MSMALPSTDASRQTEPPAGRRRSLLLGPPGQAAWVRPGLLALLLATAVLYLWDLSASGDANSFYTAAVWAGTRSWKALFFGSLDPSNAITVDKPPAALWVMGLSGRIFGFSSWSMLVPQALEGVASVGLLYAAVRRWSGPVAGLVAGGALALTPVAALMFRFNNPDALLVLLLVAAAYCTVRATETASVRWLVLAGVAVGTAFLAKMLQGYIVIPALALTYLVAAPTTLWRRIGHLLAGAVAIAVSTGWFLAVVALVPASQRPFVGGSTDNSEWQLALGYNGLGRIFGQSGPGGGARPGRQEMPGFGTATGSGGSAGGSGGVLGNGGVPGGGGLPGGGHGPGGGPGGGGGFGGSTGLYRMFGSHFGTQISWLLPAALLALVAILWLRGRAPRTDRVRAAAILWGGWLLVNGLIFSYMSGIIHEYYTVAIAPPIAALVAIAAVELWRERHRAAARAALSLLVATTGVWAFVLLGRDSSWLPFLRWVLLAAALTIAAVLLTALYRVRAVAVTLAVAALVTGASGSTAWALATVTQPHTGSIPLAGPSGSTDGMGGGPGGFRGNGAPSFRSGGAGGFPGAGSTGGAAGGPGGRAGSGLPGGAGGGLAGGQPSAGAGDRFPGGGNGRPGLGGPFGEGTADAALVKLLRGTSARWAAAVVGDQSAAGLELAARKAVMAVGGWSGDDPSPTLAEFEKYVAKGEIRYYVAGGGMGGGSGPAGQIGSWVEAHFTATTVGGRTVYDLAARVR
jgi:4-amino-4-deoxy-L-arabinose transferase-like glycosyltransferase